MSPSSTSSSSTLTFTNVDACDALGAMLDDVSVVDRGAPIATVVPTLDPRLLAALAAALAMAALVLLRRAR